MDIKLIEKAVNLLKNTSFSNYQIAKETGLSQSSISNWKNGVNNPTTASSKILLDFFSKMDLHSKVEEDCIPYQTKSNNPQSTIDRLLDIIESQQRTIENLSKIR